MNNKKLERFEDIFGDEPNENSISVNNVIEIDIDKLEPFKNHPFKLYQGNRLHEMMDSIKEMGIIIPVIVRSIGEVRYEILSGHNRVNAASKVGLISVPAIVKENLTDDEATLIVTETNLIQRSFSELRHSEKAAVIATRYKAMKQQGIRKDLLSDICLVETATNDTCAPLGHKMNSRESLGEEYDLSKNTIARYVRISKLMPELQELVDEGKLAIRSGVELSYLSDEEQKSVMNVIHKNDSSIDLVKAERIRSLSKGKRLNEKSVIEVLVKEKIAQKKKLKNDSISISFGLLSRFFEADKDKKEIKKIIIKALEAYVTRR